MIGKASMMKMNERSILPVAAELTDVACLQFSMAMHCNLISCFILATLTVHATPFFDRAFRQAKRCFEKSVYPIGTLFYADCVYAASLVPNWWKLAGPRLNTSIAVLGIAPLRFTTTSTIISAVTVSLLYSLFPQSRLIQPVHFTATTLRSSNHLTYFLLHRIFCN
ncbi:conserved hypothetical protein [Trichinella spiralis]|uniref:hypothetical protein n=1 Tax=Trichinella spiralis TaxID=6334 RepID=UPI0001EFB903|nr:conserved hypothetical protein [Trichinella spiralis]